MRHALAVLSALILAAAALPAAAGNAPQRGRLFSLYAGGLFSDEDSNGISSGAELGVGLGFRYNPRWAVEVAVSLLATEDGVEFGQTALRARRSFRMDGLSPYLQAGLVGVPYDRPRQPSVIANGVPIGWREAGSGIYSAATVGMGVEAIVATRLSLRVDASYYLISENITLRGGDSSSRYGVSAALTLEP